MAMTGAERMRAYRARAQERGQALDTLPPIPQGAREMVSGIIAEALVRTRKVKDRGDRERLVSFWHQLAASQDLQLERPRLAAALARRTRNGCGRGGCVERPLLTI